MLSRPPTGPTHAGTHTHTCRQACRHAGTSTASHPVELPSCWASLCSAEGAETLMGSWELWLKFFSPLVKIKKQIIFLIFWRIVAALYQISFNKICSWITELVTQAIENECELLADVRGEKIPFKKKSHGKIVSVTLVPLASCFPFWKPF